MIQKNGIQTSIEPCLPGDIEVHQTTTIQNVEKDVFKRQTQGNMMASAVYLHGQ